MSNEITAERQALLDEATSAFTNAAKEVKGKDYIKTKEFKDSLAMFNEEAAKQSDAELVNGIDAANEQIQNIKLNAKALSGKTVGTDDSKKVAGKVRLRDKRTNKIITGPISVASARKQKRDFKHIEIVD